MAGIGFELRKILKRENLSSLLHAYFFAAVISSGAWVLSIVGILLIGALSYTLQSKSSQGMGDFWYGSQFIVQFQVSITYIIAVSLIFTGPFQLAFTRFTADRLYERRSDIVLTNFHAVSLVVTLIGGALGILVITFLFPDQSVLYRILMLTAFVLMSNIWMASIFLTSIKQYKAIVWLYLMGYAIVVVSALLLRGAHLEGLMTGFVIGHAVMLSGMWALIWRNFPAEKFISFELFDKKLSYPMLVWIGLFYNLGVWVDKFIFWFTEHTSQAIIGPLRASVIYDLPVFLAYLAIIPGMAVFLVRMETDFVEYYDQFFNAVRSGSSLEVIERHRNNIVETIRMGIFEIIKIQTVVTLLVIVMGESVLNWLGISTLYLPLLYVNVVAASLQVVLLAILNVLFYLDKRLIVLWLTGGFVALNILFTWISINLGPSFYGYGFALSLLVIVLIGFAWVTKKIDNIEYETYMLQ
jgi:uncharacterized membrane protein